MRMCFQLEFWSWYNAIKKTSFTSWKSRKALDIENNRCTAGSIVREARMASRLHSTKLIIFITRWNFKTMISILIFTFYIINQICIIILYQIRLVFLIFEIKYCLTEVLEQPGGGTPTLKVMVIRDQRHANVIKQRTLLVDADVVPHHGLAPIT